jgi:hypothetical protein
MKITKRQLRRIIKEEKRELHETIELAFRPPTHERLRRAEEDLKKALKRVFDVQFTFGVVADDVGNADGEILNYAFEEIQSVVNRWMAEEEDTYWEKA